MMDSDSDTAGRDNDTTHQTQSSDQFSVAIVGAGFAGLVLANYLSKMSSKARLLNTSEYDISVTPPSQQQQQQQPQQHYHQWSYQLFEAKARPIPVIGTICLPFASQLLFHELGGLGYDIDTNKKIEEEIFVDTADRQIVSREAFLEYLRRHVLINYSNTVVNIIIDRRETTTPTTTTLTWHPNNNGHHRRHGSRQQQQQYFVETDTNQKYGPFDVVVSADGLFGRKTIGIVHEKKEHCSKEDTVDADILYGNSKFARIGDGRWLDRIWWDFGTTRIKRGANVAIHDGLQLGKLLVEQGGYCDLDLGKFTEPSPMEQSRRWIKRRLWLLFFLLCPILVAIAYQQKHPL
jgi:hypothetical protein